ncbi:MAG: EAL domain-containing protein [Pseudomonadota bacterium]|nr:EAL domain-containing protein [Pseudomonadota bacterium]
MVRQPFLDLTGDLIASVDKHYRIEYINRAGRELLGIDPQHDLAARPLYLKEFHTERTWQRLQDEVFPRVLECGYWEGGVSLRTLAGEDLPVSLRILPHLDGRGLLTGLTGIGQDQRLKRALHTQEVLAERILDAIIEGIVITDADARIERVNPAFTQITGYAEAEVIGQTPKLLRSNHHEQPFYDAMNASVRSNGSWQGEIWNRRKSGEVYLQWMSISALEDANGEVTHFVSIFHDLTEMRAKEAQIEALAFTDPLTGMGNRQKLMQTLAQLLQPGGKPVKGTALVALMCIDIGQLSPINDRFGMRGGDQLIQRQAERLQQQLGDRLSFFRLTGDELVAIFSDRPDLTTIARYANECIDLLQVPVFLEGEAIHLSPSAGLAVFPKDGDDPDSLLACAQTAMIAAKQAGRDNYRFYDEALSNELRQRLMLEQQLKLAIQHETGLGLELYLQPKVNIADRALVGAEVLLRWHHPEKGMIPPSEFIPLAEESRLIIALDRWVFRQSCALLHQWQARLPELPRLSVNLSARQLQEPDLVEWCLHTLAEYGLQPRQLELELTETAFINLADDLLRRLAGLRQAGFTLALDDFGTGYSSLTYLRHLPLDVVKIDRSFVADLCRDARATTLLKGMIQLLSELEFGVVAEGIESDEQAELLQRIGCKNGQGFLFYRPMPAGEFMQLCCAGGRGQ